MKHALQLRTSQQLTLTPQLQQAIKLLQLSTQDVQQEVARMLDENPMLELADEYAPTSYAADVGSVQTTDAVQPPGSDERTSDERTLDDFGIEAADWESRDRARSVDDEDESYPEHSAGQLSLREHLHEQLIASSLEGRDRIVVGLLIEALDENGYFAQDLAELAELLPAELEITLDDLETALVQLQHLDLPGLGARNLGECLVLQLKALPEDTPQRDLAIRLADNHLDTLGAHDFNKLKKLLHCTDAELRVAQQLIVGLNPKPGAEFDHSVADYVVPDVIVEKHKNKWRARLNVEAMPKLRVNQMYANILQQRDDGNSSQLSVQ